MASFPIVIHHNPTCGTSRNVLAIIEAAGYAPTVIPYVAAARLPLHHRDPWARMPVAQAALEALVLVTSDQKLAQFGVPTLW